MEDIRMGYLVRQNGRYICARGWTSERNLFVENLVAVLTPLPRPLMTLYCFDTRS